MNENIFHLKNKIENILLVTDSEKMVKKADKMLFEGRVKRNDFLESLGIEFEGLLMCGTIAQEYFFEAKRCWLEGLFFATIVMIQMTFEEGLKHVFRSYYDMRDDKKNLDFVNNSGFSHIIDLAKKEKYITKKESIELHKLRKMRNPLVHVKRDEQRDWKPTGSSEFSIMGKISEIYRVEAGMMYESTAEKEAKEAIKFLKLYYDIFSRLRL